MRDRERQRRGDKKTQDTGRKTETGTDRERETGRQRLIKMKERGTNDEGGGGSSRLLC